MADVVKYSDWAASALNRPHQTMRQIITANATKGKAVKDKIERYLDDMALSTAMRVADEGMRGYKA